ncbi:hypothetical protein [Demequina sp. NBRC 110052]|uniref:hypothetical protein n=1 Tax=Demequina sp. NBRC 110052 TaxID=1570341 RepID=UPI000A0477B8|nr:hypothetical protein [Demequina sp. NBRC 110052]
MTDPRASDLLSTTIISTCYDDALARDGELLVLAGDEVVLLSPLASELVWSARHGATLAETVAHLMSTFGAPEGADPEAMVRDLVIELAARGVLELR